MGYFRLLMVVLLAALSLALAQEPASEVNPFIGTANGGNVFPGATMPFGMVQFTPVNAKRLIARAGRV